MNAAKKRMLERSMALVAVFVLLLTVLPYAARADHPEKRTVRVGYYAVADYQDRDSHGNLCGFGYDYYMQIQKYTGWKYDFVEASYADCMRMLVEGDLDIVSGVIPTDARRENMDFSYFSISNTQNKLYARTDDSTMFYEQFDEFDGADVAVMRGILTQDLSDYAARNGITLNIREYDQMDEMERALLNGEVRLLYATSIAATAQTKIVARLAKISLNYAVSKHSPEVLTELDYALQKIIDNNPDFYTQMSQKYMVSGANAIATFTKEEYDYIYSGRPVYAIMNDNWAPICWYDKSTNTYRGIAVGILDKISGYSGLQFTYLNETEFNQLVQNDPNAINNAVAILADDTVWANQQQVMMTNRILDASMVTVSKRGAPRASSPDEVVYAQPRRYYSSWKLEEDVPPENILYFDTPEECINAVNEGKADTACLNELVASYYLSMLQYSNLFATARSDFDENIALAIFQDSAAPLLGVLDKSILCISDHEITELVVENSVADSRITLTGLFYSDPAAFMGAAMLILLVVGTIVITVAVLLLKRRQLAAELASEQENAAAKTEFFRTISHELRTPLNAVLGYLDMAAEVCRTGSREQEFIGRSQNAAKQLSAVAQDMLDYTEVSSARATLRPKPFDLKKLMRQLEESTALEADRRSIHFTLEAQSLDAPLVIGDELRVAQILQSLLSNSVKFTAAGGTVKAFLQETLGGEDQVELSFTVQDTGKGMSPEFLEKVCAPFNQSDPAYSRTHGGLGLGLYLAKYYLDAMDGRMEVTSELGRGSTFTVCLPLKKAPPPPSDRSTAPSRKKITYPDFGGKNAMIVEDNGINADILARLLKRMGLIPTVFENGRLAVDALEAAPADAYQVVLMDIQMPVMDGYEATRQMRKSTKGTSLPIIAVSANAFPEDVQESYNAGMNAHLSKPVNASALIQTLTKYLAEP